MEFQLPRYSKAFFSTNRDNSQCQASDTNTDLEQMRVAIFIGIFNGHVVIQER